MEPFSQDTFNIEKIILACYVEKGQGMTIHRNRPGHGLAFHTSGIKKYVFSTGLTITVMKNEIIYLPKHSSYEVTSIEEGDCYAINFDISLPQQFAPFSCRIKNVSSMLAHFKNARNIWETKKEGYLLKCKADLYDIIYLLQQEHFLHYVSKDKKDILLPAVDYIHEHYRTEVLQIADLSKLCGITPEYFRLIFKDLYGISPKKYITELKITRAKELLASGMYSVTEVCFMSGYTDLCHFSREFKKVTGSAPKYYAETP